MKALSIRQPWAWAIVAGYKPVENRDWPTRFRGRVLVHAGKRECTDDTDFVMRTVAAQTGRPEDDLWREYGEHLLAGGLGAVIGAVTIIDCVQDMESDWFFGRYGFVLADAVSIAPVRCKGALSFFNVQPDVAAAIRSVSKTGGGPMVDQPCPDCDGTGYQVHGEAACCGQAVNWECGGRGCTGPYETPVQFECEGCQGTGSAPSVTTMSKLSR